MHQQCLTAPKCTTNSLQSPNSLPIPTPIGMTSGKCEHTDKVCASRAGKGFFLTNCLKGGELCALVCDLMCACKKELIPSPI